MQICAFAAVVINPMNCVLMRINIQLTPVRNASRFVIGTKLEPMLRCSVMPIQILDADIVRVNCIF